MNSTPDFDRVFPLTGGSSERPALHAPKLGSLVRPNIGGIVMGNRAFMRAWAARRFAVARATCPSSDQRGQVDRATPPVIAR